MAHTGYGLPTDRRCALPDLPTTNVNEIEFIFNDAAIKHVFVSGQEILDKVNNIRDRVPSLINIYSFDEMPSVDHWDKLFALDNAENRKQAESIKNTIRAEQYCHHHLHPALPAHPRALCSVTVTWFQTSSIPAKHTFQLQSHGPGIEFFPQPYFWADGLVYLYLHRRIDLLWKAWRPSAITSKKWS